MLILYSEVAVRFKSIFSVLSAHRHADVKLAGT
jgi:hypothetical protein